MWSHTPPFVVFVPNSKYCSPTSCDHVTLCHMYASSFLAKQQPQCAPQHWTLPSACRSSAWPLLCEVLGSCPGATIDAPPQRADHPLLSECGPARGPCTISCHQIKQQSLAWSSDSIFYPWNWFRILEDKYIPCAVLVINSGRPSSIRMLSFWRSEITPKELTSSDYMHVSSPASGFHVFPCSVGPQSSAGTLLHHRHPMHCKQQHQAWLHSSAWNNVSGCPLTS